MSDHLDIHEIRRWNLRAQAKICGSPARLAAALDKSDSQISQIIGESWTRNIGPRLARQCEAKLKLRKFSLDVPPPPYGEVVQRAAEALEKRDERAQQQILELILQIPEAPSRPSRAMERLAGR